MENQSCQKCGEMKAILSLGVHTPHPDGSSGLALTPLLHRSRHTHRQRDGSLSQDALRGRQDMCSCSNSVYPLDEATSCFWTVQVLQNFRYCSRAQRTIALVHLQFPVESPCTPPGHQSRTHSTVSCLFSESDEDKRNISRHHSLYNKQSTCSKKIKKKEKHARTHNQPPPRPSS